MEKPVDNPDYYSILGVSKEATRDQVRTSYKLLAIQMHPDKNRDDPTATQKFQRLVEAYSVLTDPVKREQYDQFGTIEQEEYDMEAETCECGKQHHHHNYEEFAAFRSFFTEMFNRHYKTHGFDGFVDDSDSDEEEETFVTNLWGSYGTRNRFAADWDSVPRAMFTEKQLKYQGTPPDKPGRPKAILVNSKIKVEWAKKNSPKEVLFYVLSMKSPSTDWIDIFEGDAKLFEVDPTVAGNYSFRVSAGNRAGKSQFSEVVSISVSTPYKPPEPKPAAATAKVSKVEQTKAKKKTKASPDPRLSKLVGDLQFSIEAADVNEIKKYLAAASSLPSSPELVSLCKQANEFIETTEFSQLHKRLLEGIDAKNLVELESIVGQLSNFKQKSSIERDLNRANSLLTKAQEEQQTREKAVSMLQEAMETRDLTRLLQAIELAKKHNIPVRDAKKMQRKLEKGDAIREQLVIATQNGDKLSLRELILQVKEKHFPFEKELQEAQEKLESILNEEDSLLKELYGL